MHSNGIFEAGYHDENIGSFNVMAIPEGPEAIPSMAQISIVESQDSGGVVSVVPRFFEFTREDSMRVFNSNIPVAWSLDIPDATEKGIYLQPNDEYTANIFVSEDNSIYNDPSQLPFFTLKATPLNVAIPSCDVYLGIWDDVVNW